VVEPGYSLTLNMEKSSKYSDSLMSNYEELLDAIYSLESSSGKNRKAYRPNSEGALGGYQLTPIGWKDLQNNFPSTWGKLEFSKVALDDKVARKAASDLLSVNAGYLRHYGVPPTEDSLLAAYHSGAQNVATKNLGPKGLAYIQNGLAKLSEIRNAK